MADMWIEIRNRLSVCSMRSVLVGVLCLLLVSDGPLMAQEHLPCYTLEPVVVTGTRIPEHLSRVGQSVSIISREEIDIFPADNVSDLLEIVSGVDIRQRGMHGIQADVAIRGGSFEQTLILVDGVNVSDSQTGHHNLDLPVNLEDIERIEVLKGPGARIYGQNAMAGVINIITREAERPGMGGYVKFGDYDYYDLAAHGVVNIGGIWNRLSASRRSSDGHEPDDKADFDINTFNYKGTMEKQDHTFELGLGYVDKDFGAYRFYTDRYPNQREGTETVLAYVNGHVQMKDLEIMPRAWWRRHDDDFKIDIEDEWYRNQNRTDTYGLQFTSRLRSAWGVTALGGEIAVEDLDSSNMGNHYRDRSGAFFEQKFYPAKSLILGLGTSATYYSDWGWEYWPGVELNARLAEGCHWFASAGESFRIPSYTELYYDTPANQGNRDLKPEEAWTYETGLRWRKEGLGANVSLFMRDSEDVIDWVRSSEDDPWKAENIAESKTQGFELGFDLYPDVFLATPFVSAVSIAYTYLDSDWDVGELDSKYILDHLRHQLHGSIIIDWFDGLTQSVKARYGKRMVGDSHVVVDTRLAYKRHKYEFFLEVTNLFDEQGVESGFAPMPESWIMGGIKLNLN